MKSVLSKQCCKKEEKPYPKLVLGAQTGNVYLMKSMDSATVVHVGDHTALHLGDVQNLNGSRFVAYEGDVCLTNSDREG